MWLQPGRLREIPRMARRVPRREGEEVVDRRFTDPLATDPAQDIGIVGRFEHAAERDVPQLDRVVAKIGRLGHRHLTGAGHLRYGIDDSSRVGNDIAGTPAPAR